MKQQNRFKGKQPVPSSPDNDPNRIVLQLDETLCVINEISTPHTVTDCLSENHEIELDDVVKILENEKGKGARKSIPVLDRMKGFATGVFLQPRNNAGLTSDNVKRVDVSSERDNISIDCRGVDELERNVILVDADGSENVETPYDDFAPSICKDETTQKSEEVAAFTEAASTGEPQQPQYEFRNVNVSIQLKELIGITRISRKKFNFQDANVTSVVSYQGHSIDNNESIFIDSESMPLVFDGGSKKGKGFARWEKNEEGTEESAQLSSTIAFSRSVMKPLNSNTYVEQDTEFNNDGDLKRGFEVKGEVAKLHTVSDTFAPDIVTLQVSLQSAEQTIPIGVATLIIPWDSQESDIHVPVVQNCTDLAVKKKKLFAMGSSAYVAFANDGNTKYKMEDNASLVIHMKVSAGEPTSDQHALHVRQINNDNQYWQKIGAAGSKLTFYQRLQLFTALRKQEDPQPKIANNESRSSTSSKSKTSDEPDTAQTSVDANSPSTPTSRGNVTGQSLSPKYSHESQLSAETEASNVPLCELHYDDAEIKNEEQLSEISDSDSSCVTGSSGGTLTYSLYSAFSLKQTKGSEMTENVIKFLTCDVLTFDPTLFFRGTDPEEKKIVESSDSSCGSDDVTTSSGSTLSSSVYEGNGNDIKEDTNQVMSFDTHVYELPLDESADAEEEDVERSIANIARLTTFDTPVRTLPV